MSYPHPQYPDLKVYETGEDPRPGSFYLARQGSGQNLISLVGKAYGSGWRNLQGARNLNSVPWNRNNCTYRDSSHDCSSPVVPSDGASEAGFNEGPWLALGCPEQVIWFPPSDWWVGPEHVSDAKGGSGGGRVVDPKFSFHTKTVDPEFSFHAEPKGGESKGGESKGGEDEETEKERKWWPYLLGIGVVVGATVIVLWPKKR